MRQVISNRVRTQRQTHDYVSRFTVKCLLLCLMLTPMAALAQSKPPLAASLTINAAKVEGAISPALYGQFMEFMFEGVKGGVTAELIRNRSFEEAANAIGLSRYWERY